MTTLDELQELDPIGFEHFVKRVLEGLGYSVLTTKTSGDHGVDLILLKQGERSIAQCKRIRGTVSAGDVRDFYGTIQHEKAKRGFFITTGTFSLPALVWSRGKNITLVDGVDLAEAVELGPVTFDEASKQPRQTEALPAWEAAIASARGGDSYLRMLIIGEPPEGRQFDELLPMLCRSLGLGIERLKHVYVSSNKPVDIAAIATSFSEGDVVVLDDVPLAKAGEVVSKIASGTLEIVLGRGPGARSVKLSVPAVHLVWIIWDRSSLAKLPGRIRREVTDAFQLVPASGLPWENLDKLLPTYEKADDN
jgi:Restriction endonuclease/Holliday junction DNA helicase RuvB P-loop domain